MAYKLSDWNDLLVAVNNVLENPPEDTHCSGTVITPLPLVEENHRWSKADIAAVHSKLLETKCDQISFSTIPDKWSQAILDEINIALSNAWCDCFVFQPEIIYKTLPLEPYACCSFSYTQDHSDTVGILGDPHVGRLPPDGNDFNLSDEINGLKVMCKSSSYRFWKAYNSITGDAPQTGPRLNVTGGGAGEIGQYTGYSGYINRDGRIVCSSFKQNGPQWRRYSSYPYAPVAYCTYWTYYCLTGDEYCQGTRDACVDRLSSLDSLGHTRYEFTLRFTDSFGNPIETTEDCDCDP